MAADQINNGPNVPAPVQQPSQSVIPSHAGPVANPQRPDKPYNGPFAGPQHPGNH
jgi:hypothetical protein